MSAGQVEARSLSDINSLAANPPQYPTAPSGKRHEPLTLYISRVPGTRDVILSTFKPQLKNVTGEDVANSLYYVHLDLPSDEHLVPPGPIRDQSSPRSSIESIRSNAMAIPRKPLPSSSKVPKLESHESAPAAVVASHSVTTMTGQVEHPPGQGPPPDVWVPPGFRLEEPPSPGAPKPESHENVPPVVAQPVALVKPVLPPPPTAPPRLEQQQVRQAPPPDIWIPPGYRLEEPPTLEQTHPSPRQQQHQYQPAQPPYAGSLMPSSPPAHRRPMGPRPLDGRRTPEKELPGPPDMDSSSPRGYYSRQLPPPQTSPSPRRSKLHYEQTAAAPIPIAPPPMPNFPSLSPPKRESSPRFVPFQLTIIRRDPTSGNQWNVGKVSSYQVAEPAEGGSDASDSQISPTSVGAGGGGGSAAGQPVINVHLETSGYAKFRGFPTRRSMDAWRPSSSTSLPQSILAGSGGGGGARGGPSESLKGDLRNWAAGASAASEDGGFSRQVIMSYTKSWTSNIRQALKRREQQQQQLADSIDDSSVSVFDLEPPKRPHVLHARHGSTNSVLSVDSTASGDLSREGGGGGGGGRESPPPLITKPGPGLKPRGYVFSTPWDSRCEFQTGNGGRSLKCRHILPSGGSGGGYNPLVLAQGIRDGHGLGHGRHSSLTSVVTGAEPVSELRFNLPISADLFRPPRSKRDSRDLHPNLHSAFDRFMRLDPRRGSASGEDDEYDDEEASSPIDGLGRERAGGGNRGRRAKLGKLIVYDEGIKMLDLVVAANIGIWWGAWERAF